MKCNDRNHCIIETFTLYAPGIVLQMVEIQGPRVFILSHVLGGGAGWWLYGNKHQ